MGDMRLFKIARRGTAAITMRNSERPPAIRFTRVK
jgi:hypothetical protein